MSTYLWRPGFRPVWCQVSWFSSISSDDPWCSMNHFTLSPPHIVCLTCSMISIDLVAKVWANSIWKQSLSKARKRGALIPDTMCVRYCNILSPLAQIQNFICIIHCWMDFSFYSMYGTCWCAAYLTCIIAILTVAEDVTAVNLCRKEFLIVFVVFSLQSFTASSFARDSPTFWVLFTVTRLQCLYNKYCSSWS
jgi:hypothetical protein